MFSTSYKKVDKLHSLHFAFRFQLTSNLHHVSFGIIGSCRVCPRLGLLFGYYKRKGKKMEAGANVMKSSKNLMPALFSSTKGLRGNHDSPLVAVADVTNMSEKHDSNDIVLCHLFIRHMISGDIDIDNSSNQTRTPTVEERHKHFCKLDRDGHDVWKFRSIELPSEFSASHKSLFPLNPVLRITEAKVTADTADLSDASTIEIHSQTSPHRRLAPKTGNLKILSIYVTSALGDRPSNPVDEIKNGILGTGPSPAVDNPLKQLQSCSFGALNIQPGTIGNNVKGGVLQVQVNRRLDSSCDMVRGTCAQEITEVADAALGRSVNEYDMILYCLPDGIVSDGITWGGFAYTGQKRAFFRGGICAIMSTVGHEIGHLLGMGQ
jgi:hypothetical protein